MLRTTMLALATAVTISGLALGSPAASAAPMVTVRVFEGGGPVQPVWYRPYYHRYGWYRHHRRWW